ncbi:unnamed protein product [Rotaria magnacalcarata]|uniref:Uncharacterized protein n=2 Tax=Rotaria magnacalcarata TaxID=392030 RepID=A0A820B950_9BILA|nr:unnamed protein product [Rotaria magnacalcarata]CAF4188837.1 unnamed protein product [Rotaria magnacalcarata]
MDIVVLPKEFRQFWKIDNIAELPVQMDIFPNSSRNWALSKFRRRNSYQRRAQGRAVLRIVLGFLLNMLSRDNTEVADFQSCSCGRGCGRGCGCCRSCGCGCGCGGCRGCQCS